jgi:phosphonate transport system substrate-binding protein
MASHLVSTQAVWRPGFLLLICLSTALGPASAVRGADGPLLVGVFPRYNAAETTTRYTPLANYLQERLHRKVALLTSKDFQSFWRGIEDRRYDIVQYNQYHYIRSAKTYQVIAHNKEFGKSTMAGALYVRKDSGITDLKQLRGGTVLFGGGEDAMISYIVPVYLMLQAGLKKDEFKSQFAVTPINSVIGVYHKQAEAAGSADNALGQPVIRNAINTDELTALAVSEQLLQLPWAVKRTTSASLRDAIQSALVDLENTEAGRNILKTALLTGIGKAQDKDYDPHRKMVQAVMGHSN